MLRLYEGLGQRIPIISDIVKNDLPRLRKRSRGCEVIDLSD